jgi:hypothetical protein
MPQTRATDSLSDKARAVMTRGFAAGWAASRIAQAVLDETGEKVAERTLSRRAAEWRIERDRRRYARERIEDLVAAMNAGGMDASEQIQALAMDYLTQNPEALTSSDPVKVQTLSLQAEKLRLDRRQLDLRERRVAVDEKKLAMLEQREQRTVEALKDHASTLTPEQRLAEIREIYGLSREEAS